MRLKLITYNIKSGLYHPDGLEAVARVLERAEPQVIALQEVDRDTRRARHEDQTAWLADRLGFPYHSFGAATPWEGGGEYGLALISAFPLLDPTVTHLWVPQGTDVPHGAREPRIALSARVRDDEGTDLTVLVTHLGLTDEQRLRQAEQLLKCAAGAAAGRVVVTGDLNGRPDSPEVRLLAASLTDSMATVPESERITFPSGDPMLHGQDFLARSIDYIFVGSGVQVEDARVLAETSMASDHNPCEAILIVEPAAVD